ncbi:MAG: Sec-independent protein translocase protein TatB [Methylobacterium sp.]|uniref:Sec-independent protein translocase protein TatB n=1 Tax=Methylobacterium sp. TaxID=409 RepID=UPI002584248C|nr:Sec-independent protein translocase protein TatB [Methylobacterium sp.]MBY0298048.1 Sec-independent protein translocase protein TatB [Methylobacterium sp.]
MFDMSWGEVMLIGGVALIVIGPKDLPKALRTVGQMTAKLKRMAGEFQAQFSEAMREAELDEVRREVDGINRSVSTGTSFNPIQSIRDEIKGAIDRPAAPPPSNETLAAATAQLQAEAAATPALPPKSAAESAPESTPDAAAAPAAASAAVPHPAAAGSATSNPDAPPAAAPPITGQTP